MARSSTTSSCARCWCGLHRVRRLYLFWSNQPTVRIDITDTIDRKLAALRAHASQLKEPEKLEEWIRKWATEEGQAIGAEAGEALRLIVIDEDEEADEMADTSADVAVATDAAETAAASGGQ
jgi:LmbE family N-acetylglucosaminyl deacetylase